MPECKYRIQIHCRFLNPNRHLNGESNKRLLARIIIIIKSPYIPYIILEKTKQREQRGGYYLSTTPYRM